MPNKMLIDATHPEETRVVVVRGNRVEEFDFEFAQRKQLRGNIYLAKVTRVEPSLQAAFVEYGGNRHGFLAFSEIHPDYYQIPVADRQALIEDEERAQREAEEESENRQHRRKRHRNSRRRGGDRDRVRSRVDRNRPDEAQPLDAGRARAGRVRLLSLYAAGRRSRRPRPTSPRPRSRCRPLDQAEPGEAPELSSAHETSIDAVSDPATASGQVLPSEEDVSEAATRDRRSRGAASETPHRTNGRPAAGGRGAGR